MAKRKKKPAPLGDKSERQASYRYSEQVEDAIKQLGAAFGGQTGVDVMGSIHIVIGTRDDDEMHVLICDGGDVDVIRKSSTLVTLMKCLAAWMDGNQIPDDACDCDDNEK